MILYAVIEEPYRMNRGAIEVMLLGILREIA
jgi:hypothetical protein